MDKKWIGYWLLVGAGVTMIILLLTLRQHEEITEWLPENSLHRTTPPRILQDMSNPEPLLKAIDLSLTYLRTQDPALEVQYGPDRYSLSQLTASLMDFKVNLKKLGLSQRFFSYINANYIFYESSAERVLFTGYFEAFLHGSTSRTGDYLHPLYAKPDDLLRINLSQFPFFEKAKGLPSVVKGRLTGTHTVGPYYSREEIDYKKILSGRNLELLWINDPADVFFLQIQGSGIVEMEDGSRIRVNYAESNGHPYRSIGRYLVQKGALALEEASMQGIRHYLKTHPEEMNTVFNYNPSYVFFRTVEEGPLGSIGVPVTAYRSIATDYRLFPRGALCFIDTELPDFENGDSISSWRRFRAFCLNQDTGGAIRGPGRVDLFTGFGKESELIAGHMRRTGRLYFFIKRVR